MFSLIYIIQILEVDSLTSDIDDVGMFPKLLYFSVIFLAMSQRLVNVVALNKKIKTRVIVCTVFTLLI